MPTGFISDKFHFNNLFRLFIIVLFSLFIQPIIAQDTAQKLFNKGYYHLSVDKIKAVDYLTACINTDSSYTDAYYHRGIAYFKLGVYDSAMMDFNKTYGLNPNLDIIWMFKGFTYRNIGQLDMALECFSNYISLNPTDTAAYSYILKGKMKYELGDFEGAIENYDMALKLQPFEEKYQYYRFVALFEAGEFKRSMKAVNKLININNEFYGYYFYKGNVYTALTEYDSAIYMYSIAIIKNYQNGDSYYHRANAYEQKGALKKALEDYNTAIVLKPSDGTFFSKRGNCKYSMGNKEGACKDWDEAGALGYYEDFDKMKQLCEELHESSEGK